MKSTLTRIRIIPKTKLSPIAARSIQEKIISVETPLDQSQTVTFEVNSKPEVNPKLHQNASRSKKKKNLTLEIPIEFYHKPCSKSKKREILPSVIQSAQDPPSPTLPKNNEINK